MKVTRSEALAVSRAVLTKAERERMEERMELKPIDKMDDWEICYEINARLGVTPESKVGDVSRRWLEVLRDSETGTENLKPPEPEWKRWRKWPEEKPVDKSTVILRPSEDMEPRKALYYSEIEMFLDIKAWTWGKTPLNWRYLEPPIEWRTVERDGMPTEYERYWVKIKDCEFAGNMDEWCKGDWEKCDKAYVIAYCPIAPPPPPPYEEGTND